HLRANGHRPPSVPLAGDAAAAPAPAGAVPAGPARRRCVAGHGARRPAGSDVPPPGAAPAAAGQTGHAAAERRRRARHRRPDRALRPARHGRRGTAGGIGHHRLARLARRTRRVSRGAVPPTQLHAVRSHVPGVCKVMTMCIEDRSTVAAPGYAVHEIQEDLECAVQCDTRVLITGESGVGNRQIAELIHRRSSRAEGPFLTVDCAATPDFLLEAKLFGQVRDRLRGMDRTTRGVLEQAHRGTVFMFDIDSIGLMLQGRLLQFLEDGAIRRVGADRPHTTVDVRLITSADRDLFTLTQNRRFREDLYYRLNVMQLVMPPLHYDSPALILS